MDIVGLIGNMTYFQRDNKPKETADVLYKYNTIRSVLSSTYLRSIGNGREIRYIYAT